MISSLNSGQRAWGRLILASLALLALLCGNAFGQETTGGISGQVTDASGAAVPGAKVEISGATLPRPIVLEADASGAYHLAQMAVGTYNVTATATGFSALKKTAVPIVLGKTSRLDFKLEVGQVTESVVINADAVMVDTSSSSSAINVDKSFFDLMPKGRSFYSLVNMAPGARDEGKSGGYQVDGASGSENTFYLDGMEVTNVQTGVLNDQNKVPVEMVQQVQVKNGVMEAQYGGAMGGVVNAVLRSGTNEYHGQVGFYFDNDGLNGRPRPTLQLSNTDDTRMKVEYFQNPMDRYTNWNPIFSLGGPMVKNKLFFYSGFMPTVKNIDRDVTFLDGTKGTYHRKDFQHYMANKVDYVPFTKVRMNASWLWNPNYKRGRLPSFLGTDSPTATWSQFGEYSAGNVISGQIDYLATSKFILSVRGGYFYNNFTDRYAIPNTTGIYYSNSNVASALDIPADLRAAAGWRSQAVSRSDYRIYRRINLNIDGSYIGNWKGQHTLKFGWQTNRLSNDVLSSTYPNGYYRYYWGQNYTCVTSQCAGKQTGSYGYYRYRLYADMGTASSDNNALFLQDAWRVNKHLTLNLGLRAEREFLPSFSSGVTIAAPPIEFGFPKKISPRIGGAYDVKGDGKIRVYASWGYFYDMMKYELPLGSFGGSLYMDYFHALDDPNLVKTNQGLSANPKALPGKFYEFINWRIPANDPNNNTVDPNLKPMKQHMLDIGTDYSLSPTLVASLRYTNRRLIRTIEDVGTLGPEGEIYYIANPGEGIVANPKTWDAGFPTTPKAKRNYDALEFRLDKRFSKSYQFAATYTWSHQSGNYSGLASSDEAASGTGRTSPNVNRYFDLPWLGYNEKGAMADGPLATDRPHTFKFFGSYLLNSKLGHTTIAPNISLYSGSPLTTEINAISTTPVYPYDRGDMGRTPVFVNFDANIAHEVAPFKSHEQVKMRFEFTVFNLFNTGIVTNKNTVLLHADDGQLTFNNDADIFKGFNTKALMTAQGDRVNPLYGLASGWQGPRSARLQLSFFF